MNLSVSNVLITGGSDGIGKSLAKRFIEAGSRVIATGRGEERLRQAAGEIPGLEIFANDIGNPDEREKLAEHIKQLMPGINILVNNAGIQRRVELAADTAPWAERQAEIDILLSAPVHLNHLLIPVILANGAPSLIVNVTSGGAYIPQVFAPVYSACKAALHSYTGTLRHSLAGTACRVAELIPPAVQTGLAGGNTAHGAALEAFADTFNNLFIEDEIEVGYKTTENISVEISGKPLNELFTAFSGRFPVKTYKNR
ncbi:SDR family oxidoreductase [Hufsiella ginkgonis]|uniref:SDR family NAD(P)-dependent oxidoreductase n=1 Tax=Hufsiella ginkgonis TaxID=2695274 RepID=A0A7K1XVM1_9SPHI|nr:SDR family NAD(P)-dependent oxidoreductase [Hufsiella ginkgonis]MXV15043.1 SDR family NAD(P)-dependent oxidoreductase [Hufsiella ginkgonis]